MTMLEKMAEAMNARAGSTEYGPVLPPCLVPDLARSALLAIREPNGAMLACEGVRDAFAEVNAMVAHQAARTGTDGLKTDPLPIAFTAMIDAALAEGVSE